jgi:AbrB family looped-hinge helix DNA binding protein
MKYQASVAVDSAGRIVIPKPLPDQLQLRAGTTLLLEAEEDKLVLRVGCERSGCLERRDGILVIEGALEGVPPSVDHVRQQQARRAAAWPRS